MRTTRSFAATIRSFSGKAMILQEFDFEGNCKYTIFKAQKMIVYLVKKNDDRKNLIKDRIACSWCLNDSY